MSAFIVGLMLGLAVMGLFHHLVMREAALMVNEREDAILHLQERVRKCADMMQVCSERIIFAGEHNLSPDLADLARAYRKWADADIACLARPPGTCPDSCLCKREVQ